MPDLGGLSRLPDKIMRAVTGRDLRFDDDMPDAVIADRENFQFGYFTEAYVTWSQGDNGYVLLAALPPSLAFVLTGMTLPTVY